MRFIVRWTYCGESLTVNVTLPFVRNSTTGREDAVFQACLKVMNSRYEDRLLPDLACDIWTIDSPLVESIWETIEANGGIVYDA